MTAALNDVQTADSRITAPASSAVEGAAAGSGDVVGHFVSTGVAESAGLLVVEGRFSIVPEWVLDADVSDAAVRLYAVLLRFGATSGQRMPSRRTLADRLRKKSVDSVDRAMKELVAVGAVEVTRRFRDGVSLTNRYLVRTTRPGTASRSRRGDGGRKDAATLDAGDRVSAPPACADGPAGGGRGHGGSRRSAATPGRTDAAGVAARMRPDPEFLTETNPPPHPSSGARRAGGGAARLGSPADVAVLDAGAAEVVQPAGTLVLSRSSDGEAAARRARVLAALGLAPSELVDLAARCAQMRQERGLPAALWTAGRLAEVLADAVLDRELSPAAAIPALLAIAADPVTRSPARLRCPGPWWDRATTPATIAAPDDDVQALEAILGEVGGLRVVVQRQARALLAAEGVPVTRQSVARRAVQLLDGHDDERDAHGSPDDASVRARTGRSGHATIR